LVNQVRVVIPVLMDRQGLLELLETRVLSARLDCLGIKVFKEELEFKVPLGQLDHKDSLET